MNNLRIKIAGLSDVDVIYSLDQEYENETYSKELILGSLSNNKDLSLIAYIDDIPVGYIAYEVVLNEAELLKVVVSKDARRMGIGKHLLQQSLLVLKNKNVDSVFLEVRKSNKPAWLLYEKFGFVKIHERLKYYDGVEDACIYRLVLNEWNKL